LYIILVEHVPLQQKQTEQHQYFVTKMM